MCKTLLKSAWQLSYANFPLISNKVSCVSCLLVGSQMLGSAFNTLTADQMYSCDNRDKFPQHVPTELYSKPKTFSAICIAILKSTFWKKALPSYLRYFPSYWFRKMWLLWMPKSSCFRTAFGSYLFIYLLTLFYVDTVKNS